MFRKLLTALLVAAASPAAAAWHEASTQHFVIYADQSAAELRAFATKLEKFDRALRWRYGLEDFPLGPNNRLTVFVVRDAAAVRRLEGSGRRTVAGFYVPRASGSFAIVPRRSGDGGRFDLDEDQIFFHEYAHHFMLGNFAGAFPAWFVEGFAEFYATARFEPDGAVGLGDWPRYRAYSLVLGNRLPLERMLSGAYGRLAGDQWESIYSRGWTLLHYLTFEPTRQGQLKSYIDAINGGEPAAQAASQAFGDLRTLDRELDAYLQRKRLKYIKVPAAQLSTGPIAVRPLSLGEAAFMPVRLRSVRGVDEQTAAALVADARRVGAAHPKDAIVQGWLAEVEHDARNWAEADAAADRALAADPKSVQGLIYKGRIAMARAARAEAKDAKTWTDVRRWFIRASQADTEDAEPKVLFHGSFLAQGAPPTRNAVEALTYAMELAPQDGGLRMQVARQHLIDGKAAEARRALAPVAYSPHGGGMRDFAALLLARIGNGDAKAALQAWDAAALAASAPAAE